MGLVALAFAFASFAAFRTSFKASFKASLNTSFRASFATTLTPFAPPAALVLGPPSTAATTPRSGTENSGHAYSA